MKNKMKRIDMTHLFSLNNPFNLSWFMRYTLCIPNNNTKFKNLQLTDIQTFKVKPLYKNLSNLSKRWKLPITAETSFDEYYDCLENLISKGFVVLEKKIAYPDCLKILLFIYSSRGENNGIYNA